MKKTREYFKTSAGRTTVGVNPKNGGRVLTGSKRHPRSLNIQLTPAQVAEFAALAANAVVGANGRQVTLYVNIRPTQAGETAAISFSAV